MEIVQVTPAITGVAAGDLEFRTRAAGNSGALPLLVCIMPFDPRTVTVEVVFRRDRMTSPVIVALDVEPRLFDLSPLPRDRDFPNELIAGPAKERAAIQERDRRRMADMVSRQLAPLISDAIVEAIGQQDTVNGYSREEWDRMHVAD